MCLPMPVGSRVNWFPERLRSAIFDILCAIRHIPRFPSSIRLIMFFSSQNWVKGSIQELVFSVEYKGYPSQTHITLHRMYRIHVHHIASSPWPMRVTCKAKDGQVPQGLSWICCPRKDTCNTLDHVEDSTDVPLSSVQRFSFDSLRGVPLHPGY